MSSSDNDITVQSYSDHVKDYVTKTRKVSADFSNRWIDESLKNITAGDKILELGSAYGRDTAHITSKGFTVIAKK